MRPDDQQLLQAFNASPQFIQDALSDGIATRFMIALPKRYDMHLDTARYIMDFIRDMLLGFLRPEQFTGKLESIGITGDKSRQLISDLNKEVFIPLRDEMKKGGAMTRPSAIPHVPVMKVAEPAPSPVPPPAPQPSVAPAFNLIQDVPVISERAAPPVSAPIQTTGIQPSTPTPMMRTMQHDIDLLQHGAQASAYPAPAEVANLLHPSQLTPAQSFQTASVPVTSMPVPSRPITPAAVVVPATQNPPIQTPEVQQAPRPTVASSSDPYREPI